MDKRNNKDQKFYICPNYANCDFTFVAVGKVTARSQYRKHLQHESNQGKLKRLITK